MMIENGYMIALNDDAEEVGGKIPCHYNLQTMAQGYTKTNDGQTIYYDARILIAKDDYPYEGMSVYDQAGRPVGRFVVGSRRYNQATQTYEMMAYKY